MGGLIAWLVALALSSTAFAEGTASNTTADTTPATWLVIALGIAYLTRRGNIGGWLLCFYMQVYGYLLAVLLFALVGFNQLMPSAWDTNAHYVWHVLAVVPVEITALTEVVLATALLWRRNEALLEALRRTIWALVLFAAVAICIDMYQPKAESTVPLDMFPLINSMIWLLYLYRSKRVERVFVYRNFVYDEEPQPKPTPQTRKYRLKRATLSAIIIFVLSLILFGAVEQGDKKPDPTFLFIVPGTYAVIAFLIGWAVPIGKKRYRELSDSRAPIA